MVFSVMLWAPSWGGMLNGLLTLRGAWDKLRTDPVVKFFVVAVTFYGMSTFEGPLLSIKSVSALGHYTDWIIGHVHGGALGWNGFLTFGMLYWLVPRLWKTELWSKRLAETHFWLATLGILLYVVAMWISGVSQGLFWRALDADGFLKYPDFVEGLLASRFMYQMRLIGGTLYFLSYLLAIVNYVMTIRQGSKATYEVTVPALTDARPNTWRLLFGAPVVYSAVVIVLAVLLGISGVITSALTLAGLVVVAIAAILTFGTRSGSSVSWHRLTEANSMAFTVLVLLAILVGGIVEIIPTVVISKQVPTDAAALAANPHIQQPYSPLELEGRDLYVREGCYVCHSQMIRPFRHETLRYGDYSRMEEFIYDHPFQWGSKRTGPDLHREGGKYANLWHYLHMQDPRSTSPGSNMPSYAWLKTGTVDFAGTGHKMETLSRLDVPYTEADIASAKATALSQAGIITADLSSQGVNIADDSELVALIGYLQRLGRGPQPTAPATGGANAAAAPDTVSVGEGS